MGQPGSLTLQRKQKDVMNNVLLYRCVLLLVNLFLLQRLLVFLEHHRWKFRSLAMANFQRGSQSHKNCL